MLERERQRRRDKGRTGKKRRERVKVYVGLECRTYKQTAPIYLLLEYRWAGLHY